jgi:ATP-dependent DNA helicase RecQ
MKPIAFVDLEVHATQETVLDIGATNDRGHELRTKSWRDLAAFLPGHEYICGHNILAHDIKYMQEALQDLPALRRNTIDTLLLSPLLFPKRPYHTLVKDEKLQVDELNNPLADATKAKELLYEEIAAFHKLDDATKRIFFGLLGPTEEFGAFFRFVDYRTSVAGVAALIREAFASEICANAPLDDLATAHAIPLAYALAVISVRDRYSITPPWVLKQYPVTQRVLHLLRNTPCLITCPYCAQKLDVRFGLKRLFGFDAFRTFGGQPLQEQAARAALANKSLLAVFPTGGGKSVTFQVPGLISGEAVKGLTVVISPLQALMKDQVDNLERLGITDAVTINGLLDPIERAKSFERVLDGSASLLYISPESLRSRSVERLLLGRNVVRFVIDEAHCFSAWGQDFRVDYLYIGEFIKKLQADKNATEAIPVSCFTATAKQRVIDDIRQYFKDKLGLTLDVFRADITRENLHYHVVEQAETEEKYRELRRLVQRGCPAIVYVSETKRAENLAARLTSDGFPAHPYHGQLDAKVKSAHQDAFIAGEVAIMVATSAFGMGVDKKDVGQVIHYDIPDSLENYVQEAGRAGRDEQIKADCYILYREEDLNSHFVRLSQNKLHVKEIQQVWKAIQNLTRTRRQVSQSALEIARLAGWDDQVADIETRVRAAIAALEQRKYVKRGQNSARVFADSIMARTAQEAIEKINQSTKFNAAEQQDAVRIIRSLIASRSRARGRGDDSAASEVDDLADRLGLAKERVIALVNLLREEGLLADAKDLTAYIKLGDQGKQSLEILKRFSSMEAALAAEVQEEETLMNLKEQNGRLEGLGCQGVNPRNIRTILNLWKLNKLVECANADHAKHLVHIRSLLPKQEFLAKIEKRKVTATIILEHLYSEAARSANSKTAKEEALVEFSVRELLLAYQAHSFLFKEHVTARDIEEALLFLSRIDAIKIEGGFLVSYNPMTIERLHQDSRKRYTLLDYRLLAGYYHERMQQIHIIGEYARQMLKDYQQALNFVHDYFSLDYDRFLNKHFSRRKHELELSLTPAKFRQLFVGALSPRQLSIIQDKDSRHICVLAGPGSGKTKLLVYKLASLILMEDVKYEQLLMLTFSRAAVTEFKQRLSALIGGPARHVEIKTFHSYCFDLLGRVGSLTQSADIINLTVQRIRNGEVEASRIAKTVLVIDEAQDMDASIYELVKELIAQNEGLRVIMVGDDDQNIFQFRGSSAEYMARFIAEHTATKYELLLNYRSKANLVAYATAFAARMKRRLKSNPIESSSKELGCVKVVRQLSPNMLWPFVEDIAAAELKGTTSALVRTNAEAWQVVGMLRQRGLPARLIQTNDSFGLHNLDEVRFLLARIKAASQSPLVEADTWEEAKQALETVYQRSAMLETCRRLIAQFESQATEQKYISDLETFVQESKLEDFIGDPSETIVVSTIHKSKGKEFDNVFLLLNNNTPPSEDDKRSIYVAITRAKSNLTIRHNGDYLSQIKAADIVQITDRNAYPEPTELILPLSHEDVQLGAFAGRQDVIQPLQSGDELRYQNYCGYTGDRLVFRVAKKCEALLAQYAQRGFVPTRASVNFVVWWGNKDTPEEVRVVLPVLYLTPSAPAAPRE